MEILKIVEEILYRHGIKAKVHTIDTSGITFDRRVRWKCMFGCESYGKKSCPPFVPEFDECVKFVKSYRKAVVFVFSVSSREDLVKAQKFMLDVEREVSRISALCMATFPSGCLLCDDGCAENCKLARPSLSALCINVGKLGMDLNEDEMVAVLFI